MPDALLVLNAGSSSLKFSAYPAAPAAAPLVRGRVEGIGTAPRLVLDGGGDAPLPGGTGFDHEHALGVVLERCAANLAGHTLVAAGHRIVHGGTHFSGPVRIDAEVLAALVELVPLAPLHQPHGLAAVRAVTRRAPQLAQVACFDTAFHRTMPEVAQRFALPRKYTDDGVRRYGFHGLSYEFLAAALPEHDPRAAAGRTVVAHLGNGASLCAVLAGKSVATTMSFTPADGLMMGTRTGALDPAVVLHLMARYGLTPADVERVIDRESGLLGVSGISSDMRALLASPDPRAAEAVELFAYRIGRELGSMAAALGGLDALVFTGGIGEHAAPVRAAVCRAAAWLGVELDDAANAAGGPRITRPGSRAAAWVLPTDEERMIAAHTRRVLGLV